ncbi:MAG: hypothetical protein HY903_03785 [Deltaproteobacteria bacterium]|nr:hypothetical protein [Deltaproteobacteria bacterium]
MISLRLRLVLVVGLTTACTGQTPILIGVQLEGESCKQASDCQAGLDCLSGVCTPIPPLATGPQPGDPCQEDADCAPALVCGRQEVCTARPLSDAGQGCSLTIQCKEPLICNGITGTCGADDGSYGTHDFGDACGSIFDCQRPFICNFDGVCERPPYLDGANCALSDAEAGAFRVYFELPPEGPLPDPYEFDRLPFPTDLRVTGGHVSLSGHEAPNDPILGVDIRATYFAAVEEDVTGFALTQPVFFRFSDIVDPASVCLDEGSVYPAQVDLTLPPFCARGGAPNVYLVNIDPDAGDDYGRHIPVQLNMSRESGMYICQNWLGIAPKDGEPLLPHTTYAAIVTTGVRDIRGEAPIRDRDFAELMIGAQSRPAMQPLLTFLSGRTAEAAKVAAAAVFTTGDPTAVAGRLRKAVHALPAPTFDSGSVVCTSATISAPCRDGLPAPESRRGCSPTAPAATFHEIQGTYQNPLFQAGTRPYPTADYGGAFVYDATGVPAKQGDETLCFAVAVPKVAPPATGFPVILYAHGTSGSYRSFIDEGLAEELTARGYAVLSFDNVMHGLRQAPPMLPAVIAALPRPLRFFDAGQLFFNLLNPRAARDNVLQGAADLFHLVRLVRNPAATLAGPNGSFHFNPNRVYFLGHSQGTVIAPPFLSAEPDVAAAVLSGAGADLSLSILHKRQPPELAIVAITIFADGSQNRVHPMLGILSMLFAPTDAVNYARSFVIEPTLRGSPPTRLSVLHVAGVGDSFAPDVTQQALMRAARLPLVVPPGGAPDVPVDGVAVLETAGAKRNLPTGAPDAVTAGVAQFTPDAEYDGHFVMFNHPAARTTLEHFFATANGTNPAVGAAPEIRR